MKPTNTTTNNRPIPPSRTAPRLQTAMNMLRGGLLPLLFWAAITAGLQAQDLSLTGVMPSAAVPGSEITLQGSGFDATASAHTVTFERFAAGTPITAAPVAMNGTAQLKIQVPEGLPGGNYRITVTRQSDGSSQILPSPFGVITGGGVLDTPVSGQQVISTALNGPRMLTTADLNGDGRPDVIGGSGADGKIVWFENLGGGSLSSEKVIITGDDTFASLFAADLDGDGDQDIISGAIANGVAWFENDGTGSFSAKQIISTALSRTQTVFASDLDGDGDMDVVTASSFGSTVAWFENQGGGNFGDPAANEQIISTAAEFPIAVFAADLDGDGDSDVLSASATDNKIAWYENQGGGSFSAENIVTTAAQEANIVVAADLNGDGALDILSASEGDNKIAWYANQNDGSFGAQQVISTAAKGPDALRVADMDADGDLDVLSVSGTDDKIAWYENQGGGNFGLQQVISTAADDPIDLAVTDVNSDGDIDLLSSSLADNKIAWYENTSPPLALTSVQPHIGPPGSNLYLRANRLDPLASNHTVHFIPVEPGTPSTSTPTAKTGPNSLTAEVPAALSMAGGNYQVALSRNSDAAADTLVNPFGVLTSGRSFSGPKVVEDSLEDAEVIITADIDGDGDLDIVMNTRIFDNVASNLLWLENLDGDSNYGPPQIISANSPLPKKIIAADLDDDDDLDIVAAALDQVAWIENLGGGNFGDPQTNDKVIAQSSNFVDYGAAVGDLDGDGDLDIIANNTDEGIITWHENLGGGSFASGQLLGDFAFTDDPITTFDFDGDGDLDVLADISQASDGSTDGLGWFENLGGGSFAPHQIVFPPLGSRAEVAPVDIDGDGDRDIVAKTNSGVVWFENQGNGNYGPEQVISSPDSKFFAADWDADGDEDLFLISFQFDNNELAFKENLGGGSFGPRQVLIRENIIDLFASNVDGDSSADLLVLAFPGGAYAEQILLIENVKLSVSDVTPRAAVPGSSITIRGTGFAATPGDHTISYIPAGAGGTQPTNTTPTSMTGLYKLNVPVPATLPGGSYYVGVTNNTTGETDTLTSLLSVSTGGGFFGEPGSNRNLLISNTNAEWVGLNIADLDGDGDEDILAGQILGFGELDLVWFENLGNGELGPAQRISGIVKDAGQILFVDAGDVDNDGDVDLLASGFFSSGSNSSIFRPALTHVIENMGDGNFGNFTAIAGTNTESRAVFSDVDNDGDLDIIATAKEPNNKIFWVENFDGEGFNFGNEQIITVTNDSQILDYGDILAEDLDGDGDEDIIAGSVVDQNIIWFENRNKGDFSSRKVISNAVDFKSRLLNPYSLDTADLDGDGKPDILSASPGDNKIAWYQNQGGGNFGSQRVISSTASEAKGVFAADLNSDGMLDIVANDQSHITWYENQGGSTFGSAQTIHNNSSKGQKVIAGDIDGDGDQDLLAGFRSSVSWFENKIGVELTGGEGWRMMSVPATSGSYANLLDPLWTQGIPTGADVTNGSPNVFRWDNSSTGAAATNWKPLSDLTATPGNGEGLLTYVFEDDDFSTDAVEGGFPKTLPLEGTVPSGTITPAVNPNAGGFTLLGNPYNTALDVDKLTLSDPADFTGVSYVWNPNNGSSGNWESWNGSLGDLTDGLIAPFQGFFMENSSSVGTPSVTIEMDDRADGGTFRGKTTGEKAPLVRLELNGTGADSALTSSTWLQFSEKGSIADRVRGDALKLAPLSGSYIQLATAKPADTTLLDINHLPLQYSGTVDIPLDISGTAAGEFRLNTTQFRLPQGMSLTFNDLESGQSVPVDSTFTYRISYGDTTKAKQSKASGEISRPVPLSQSRATRQTQYSITIEPGVTTAADEAANLPQKVALKQNFPNPFNPTTTIRFALPESQRVSLTVYDVLGRRVAELIGNEVRSAGQHSVSFDASRLASGVYIYRLQAATGKTITRKLTLIK